MLSRSRVLLKSKRSSEHNKSNFPVGRGGFILIFEQKLPVSAHLNDGERGHGLDRERMRVNKSKAKLMNSKYAPYFGTRSLDNISDWRQGDARYITCNDQ